VLAQTAAVHRDPVGRLRGAQARYGDVFTLRLATARPIVVVAAPAEVEPLLHADPEAAYAGEARRRILPMASPRSIFGGDGAQHAAARERVAALFAPESVGRRRPAMEAIAERHIERWPPAVRLLARMRALVDEAFAELYLGVRAEPRKRALTVAMRRMLWTPGNPPLSIPGEGDGLLGKGAVALFRRRRAPLARLLAEEIDARRGAGANGDDVIAAMLRSSPGQPTAAMLDELLPLLMAAQEPAAAGLTWIIERVIHEPGLAERVAAAPPGDAFAGAVVREALRLRPPAIAALRRLCAPREVAGRWLPAGVTVMLPIPMLHRDPGGFPDPDSFRPERWLQDAPPGPYLPFGGGARRCLGEHLALAYVDALVRPVLRRFVLQPLWPYPERMVLRGTILVPHRSAPMRLRPTAA
jgi:cytochrome P450